MASESFTVVQVSDLHMAPDDPAHQARVELVRQAVVRLKPDLVIASGDVSDDGHLHDGMFEKVHAVLNRFPSPLYVIPGNHDVGDKPGETHEIRRDYLLRWRSVFQDDHFVVQRDNWTLIGLDTQIMGSGLREEAEQFEWLDQALAQAEARGNQIAVFLHAAAYLFEPNEQLEGPSQYWGFHPFPRRELLRRIDRPTVRLVANGHLHWYHATQRNGALHVWCPSTSFIVDDAIFPRGGELLGFMRYTFRPDGITPELIRLDVPARTILFHRQTVELPGREPITLAELVLDFTGTLSKDGRLLPGLAQQIRQIAKRIRITIMSADTFGKAKQELEDLPIDFVPIRTGQDKRDYVMKLGPATTIAIGNGRNDVPMLQAAAIGIAVIGPEGAAGELVRTADIVVSDIREALDLIANPLRIKATLRD